MLLWEAHNALAQSIGDPVTATGAGIPDGVRYSAALRDQYLYRAMLQLIRMYTERLGALPRLIFHRELRKVFTNFIERYTVATYTYTLVPNIFGTRTNPDLPDGAYWEGTMDADKVFHILAMYAGNVPYTLEIPERGVNFGSLSRDMRNSQYPDIFFDRMQINDGGTEKLRLRVYDYQKELGTIANQVIVEYLPYPAKPVYTSPTALLDFELSLLPQLINQAHIYAMIDSQDIQNVEAFLNTGKDQ